MDRDLNQIVSVGAKIPLGFRSDAMIAARKLGTTVSDVIVKALEETIAKAKQKDGAASL